MTRSSGGVTVLRFTPESTGPLPPNHIMASMPERLRNHRSDGSVIESMRLSIVPGSVASRRVDRPHQSPHALMLRDLPINGMSLPHSLGASLLTGGPLTGQSLNRLGIQLTDFGPQIGKGERKGIEGEEVFDPWKLDQIRKEMEEKRLKEEEEARLAAEAKAQAEAAAKLRKEREKDPRWQQYWADLAELKQIKDKCLEEARAAHAARDKKIGDDLDTCLFFGIAGAGAAGAAGGGTVGGPWGAFVGAGAGGALAVLYCFQTAAKERAESLLQLVEDEKKCNEAYESAVKKLQVPPG